MINFLDEIEEKVKSLEPKEIFEFETTNLDYKAWIDLAQILYCKMLTPKVIDEVSVIIRFEKLDTNNSFHNDDRSSEKYGADSIFATINKNEQPAFLHYYKQALKNVNIEKRENILNLGINSGDEFEVIKQLSSNFKNQELIGVDYCESAISAAKEKFVDDKNISLINGDINDLDSLNLEKQDLIITIGTLQSSNLNFKLIFQSLIQNYLKKGGAIILGFPNCRWVDGEMLYGAKAKNYSFSEMSLLVKDIYFCKKYLQQKKFRVTITGKEYIFLIATSI